MLIYIDMDLQILGGIWWYFAAKVTELLDTIFFVLRKKNSQVTFLHVYHHSIMMFGTWATLKYVPTQTLNFIGMLNSLVHVVMYTYYGLAAYGPRFEKYLRWKKYITKMQLVSRVFTHNNNYHHHHQTINVPNAEAQASIAMDTHTENGYITFNAGPV
jgi:elongation of very long chain fatty acids protein 7